MAGFFRAAALALVVGGLLAGCNQLHLQQADDAVIIRHAQFDEELPARYYAAHFAPYAVFSLKAYDERGQPSPRWTDDLNDAQRASAEAWTIGRGWERVHDFDAKYSPQLACRAEHRFSCVHLPGLGYQVWIKGKCEEAVVAFRGTNFTEWEDWISNFRWVTRVLPLFDQYEQVQDNIDVILEPVRQRCGDGIPIVATGHSLGGGLAQQAAYMSKRIRKVVVFDPSMVTGFFDHHVPTDITRYGLQIDRVYEHGEALAYPRLLVRTLMPNSPRDPLVRTARFNHEHGKSVFSQHSIATLTATILHFADKLPENAARPLPCDRQTFLAREQEKSDRNEVCIPYEKPPSAGTAGSSRGKPLAKAG